MKRHILRIILSILVLSSLVAISPPVHAKSFKVHVDLPFEKEGTHNDAEYRIRVPANWNGTLLVYVHGWYQDPPQQPIQIAPGWGPTSVEEELLALGYALAGSALSSGGFAIKEGIQETLALTNFFKGQVGNP